MATTSKRTTAASKPAVLHSRKAGRAARKKTASKTAAADDTVAKKAAAKKAATKKAATKKAATKKAATKKAATKKAVTKKAVTKKAVTKTAATKKAATKKASTKKTATKKAATKKAATKKVATRKTVGKKAAVGSTANDQRGVNRASKRASKTARSSRQRITPEQALANTQALLAAKQEQVRQGEPWQKLDEPFHPDPSAREATTASAASETELHAAESRMRAIQGSVGTQDRHNQGKRDNR